MFKPSNKVINFTKKTMKNRRVKLDLRGKSLAEVKILRGIFQGDALYLLLFVIAMVPLIHILRKCTDGYKFHQLQEKIYYLKYMDDMKLFAKNEKNWKTKQTNTERI